MTQNNISAFEASPVRLRYIAALRGITPAPAGEAFTYLQLGDFDPETLLCMALANPEGQFFGVIKTKTTLTETEDRIKKLGVNNLSLSATETTYTTPADFVCYQSDKSMMSTKERDEALKIIQPRLAPNGILCWRYKAYDTAKSLLQFVTDKFVEEITPNQQIGFLETLRDMGAVYFAKDTGALSALDHAIKDEKPESFLRYAHVDQSATSHGTENFMALTSGGFAYVGDADIPSNYVELALSSTAQKALITKQEHVLYEAAKDFALGRLTRNDVWVRMPAQQSNDMPTLFNPFTFGIVTPRDQLPKELETKSGTKINLQTPLLSNLIDLMAKLPLGVGDFVSHPSGEGFDANDVLASIHILVAAGLAQPMRGRYERNSEDDVQIIPTQAIIDMLSDAPITTSTVRVASPVVGDGLVLSAKEALVLQAIARVGVANSAGALFEELTSISKTCPSLASQIMDTAEPGTEMADSMVEHVINDNVTRWYAYGLMAS